MVNARLELCADPSRRSSELYRDEISRVFHHVADHEFPERTLCPMFHIPILHFCLQTHRSCCPNGTPCGIIGDPASPIIR